MATTPAITYQRKRAGTYYLTNEAGDKIKLITGWPVTIRVNDGTKDKGEFKSFAIAEGQAYRDDLREWHEREDGTGTWFYPYASPEECQLVNAVMAAAKPHVS